MPVFSIFARAASRIRVISNPEYIKEIRKVIAGVSKDDHTDKRAKFDFFKFKVKETSIKISKEIARKNREEIQNAEAALKQAEEELSPQNPEYSKIRYTKHNQLSNVTTNE